MQIKLKIDEILITEGGELLIKKLSIIDGDTGEQLRVAKISTELKTLLESCEIDITDYITFIELKKKNPALIKLVTDFNLILKAQGGATK